MTHKPTSLAGCCNASSGASSDEEEGDEDHGDEGNEDWPEDRHSDRASKVNVHAGGIDDDEGRMRPIGLGDEVEEWRARYSYDDGGADAAESADADAPGTAHAADEEAVATVQAPAATNADFFEGEDEDDDFYRLDDDDVPLLKRKLRLHLRSTTKRTRVVLSDDDIPVEEPQHRLSAAEKGKMKIVEGPSNEYRRRRTWKEKKKNDGSSVSTKGAKKKKTAQGMDYIVVNEMHVSNDEYATAAGPLPSFPENAKPKDLTLRNADSRPPSPRSRGEKQTRRSWSVREKMRWARRYKEPSSLKKTLFESSASVACIRRWAAQTDSGA
ncbi:unnamed protein product [Closterium sp. NIES-65]|nr:unnamed protein product [Closterium sp. NIES-65]